MAEIQEQDNPLDNPLFILVKDIICKYSIINNQQKLPTLIDENNNKLPILNGNNISNFTLGIVENAILIYVINKRSAFIPIKYEYNDKMYYTIYPDHIYSAIKQDHLFVRIGSKITKHKDYCDSVDPDLMMAIDIVEYWEKLANIKDKIVILDRPILFSKQSDFEYIFSLLEKATLNTNLISVKVNV